MPSFPFEVPERFQFDLGPAGADGTRWIDVKFRGRWEGVIAVDPAGRAVGVVVGGKPVPEDVPFSPAEIEAVRPSGLWNPLLARLSNFQLMIGVPVALIIAVAPAARFCGFLSASCGFAALGMVWVLAFHDRRTLSYWGFFLLLAGLLQLDFIFLSLLGWRW